MGRKPAQASERAGQEVLSTQRLSASHALLLSVTQIDHFDLARAVIDEADDLRLQQDLIVVRQ